MLKNHLIDMSIAAESLQTLHTATGTIGTELRAIAVTLDHTQSKYYQRMGVRNETFSREVLQLAQEHPTLVPATIDLTAIQRDITAREQLGPILMQLRTLTKLAEDTYAALGIDAYDGCRALYMAMKVVGKVAGIAETLKQIGRRFARPGKKNQQPTPDPLAGGNSAGVPTTQV